MLSIKCPICLTEEEIPVAAQLPCEHVFCLGCLHEWKKISSKCPLCRKNIPSKDKWKIDISVFIEGKGRTFHRLFGDLLKRKEADRLAEETARLAAEAARVAEEAARPARTKLHVAAQDGNIDVVRMLLGAGADTNIMNKDGRTPLHCAAWGGRTDHVRLLLDAGADINLMSNKGKTPLHYAEEKGHTDIVALLS